MSRSPSQYAKHMKHLSARIFGEPTQQQQFQAHRVIKLMSKQPFYKKTEFVNYYPKIFETGRLFIKLRDLGLYVDEHLDFNEEYQRLREARGKVFVRKDWSKKN
ncbi:small ribosomal subunit protein mS33-like [Styela clava]|uniref:28S ribosomal protein S33, mitochondrial-like n=1 Tax=Styela clava TaxID=7725 RepID=UPI00193955D5|nr:28S ribosomal protein S33, mitochondrial-like [Styela clava]